jgi:hypothetical protein
MGDTPIEVTQQTGGIDGTVFLLSTLVIILAIGLILMMLMLQGTIAIPEWAPFAHDDLDEIDGDETEAESTTTSAKKRSAS